MKYLLTLLMLVTLLSCEKEEVVQKNKKSARTSTAITNLVGQWKVSYIADYYTYYGSTGCLSSVWYYFGPIIGGVGQWRVINESGLGCGTSISPCEDIGLPTVTWLQTNNNTSERFYYPYNTTDINLHAESTPTGCQYGSASGLYYLYLYISPDGQNASLSNGYYTIGLTKALGGPSVP